MALTIAIEGKGVIANADAETNDTGGMDFGEEEQGYDPLTDEEAEQQEDAFKANENPFEKDLNSFIKEISMN